MHAIIGRLRHGGTGQHRRCNQNTGQTTKDFRFHIALDSLCIRLSHEPDVMPYGC